ncbi:MAG: cadmium-translocating P-type ATPase [Clostridia bacterium]|nr:cadmium-translocating P-type ATPase [Clostridia bacterium]
MKIIKLLKNPIFQLSLSLPLLILGIVLGALELELASLIVCIAALVISGADVAYSAVRGILRRDFLDEKFLMCIASIGALIIGEASEGVAVMVFFKLGEYFEHKAVGKARNSIKSLMKIRPDEACVLVNGEEILTDAEDVEVGSTIIIRAGERVPVDAQVSFGRADLDTSHLTGESLPRSVGEGDLIDSGSFVINGVLTCKTVREASDSAASRILDLVENASERKSREESFITVFARYYTPAVVAIALLLAVIPPIFSWLNWQESVYRALTFLVISCPCALVISVPMAFFGAIGGAAARGILYNGGNVFSPAAKISRVVFDKTGTLTKGEFKVSSVVPFGIGEDELTYLVASAEHTSNHPIAAALRKSSPCAIVPTDEREIAGQGVIATVDGKRVAVGNLSLMSSEGCAPTEMGDAGATKIFVAVDGEFRGYLTLSDTVKREAKGAISELGTLGVKDTVMLTGDREEVARAVADEVGINGIHARLLPEDKYNRLEAMIEESHGSVAYVGDGINDAPSLARADVGIAMGSLGSDSAIEAADIVIISDNLEKIPEAIRISRKTLLISWENIVFAISVKLLILVLGAFGIAGMWLSVFADVGVAVLAILNSMRTLSKGFANTKKVRN